MKKKRRRVLLTLLFSLTFIAESQTPIRVYDVPGSSVVIPPGAPVPLAPRAEYQAQSPRPAAQTSPVSVGTQPGFIRHEDVYGNYYVDRPVGGGIGVLIPKPNTPSGAPRTAPVPTAAPAPIPTTPVNNTQKAVAKVDNFKLEVDTQKNMSTDKKWEIVDKANSIVKDLGIDSVKNNVVLSLKNDKLTVTAEDISQEQAQQLQERLNAPAKDTKLANALSSTFLKVTTDSVAAVPDATASEPASAPLQSHSSKQETTTPAPTANNEAQTKHANTELQSTGVSDGVATVEHAKDNFNELPRVENVQLEKQVPLNQDKNFSQQYQSRGPAELKYISLATGGVYSRIEGSADLYGSASPRERSEADGFVNLNTRAGDASQVKVGTLYKDTSSNKDLGPNEAGFRSPSYIQVGEAGLKQPGLEQVPSGSFVSNSNGNVYVTNPDKPTEFVQVGSVKQLVDLDGDVSTTNDQKLVAPYDPKSFGPVGGMIVGYKAEITEKGKEYIEYKQSRDEAAKIKDKKEDKEEVDTGIKFT